MTPSLKKDLIAYANELASRGPVHNGSHHTLRRLWDTYGREVVDAGIATLPEFRVPCRRPYSIAPPVPVAGVREDFRTGQYVPTVNGVDTSPTSFDEGSALRTAQAACKPHWPAVIGKLMAELQRAGCSLVRVDDGDCTLLASGTPRQRRQQIKAVVVNSDRSRITVSVNGRSLWLSVDLDRSPRECVTEHSADEFLETVISYFHQYYV